MEKNIEMVARYHYERDYYVEVTCEGEFSSVRDYWLCKRREKRKLFMFSSTYQNGQAEEDRILGKIEEAVREYEDSTETKYA